MNGKLKTEYVALDSHEALRSSPVIMLGVAQAAAAALKKVEIESVFDLATSRLFANALRILQAGLEPKDAYYRYGKPPRDMVNASADPHRLDELRFESIDILEGLDAATAALLSKQLDVKTVRDLALWPPYEAAREILDDAYFPEREAGFDPEAPADLLPKSGEYPTERVFYHTLVLDQVDSQPDINLEQAGPIDIAPTLDQSFGFKTLGIGALLTISQSWFAKGVALGQLLHSTTLAPGESTRIAMMDWSRRTKAGTTEIISETEQLDNETMHSRSLSEVTSAVAREAQQGFSSTNNTTTAKQKGKSSGSATVNVDVVNALTGGLFGDDPGVSTGGTSESESTVDTSGMTFTTSSGQRSLQASTTQNVLDRTQQHANSVRNRRASIVREVSQEEHQSVSTRVVTNYNHMHALSIQYYEVVQIYRVEVGISEVEKCIFIPMKLVDFTQPVVDKYRLVLARSAIDRKAYESLTTRYGVVEVMPQTPRITINRLLAKVATFQIAKSTLREDLFALATETASTSEPAAVAKAAETPVAKAVPNIRPSLVDVLAAKGYEVAQLDYAAKLIGKGVVRADSDSLFLPDDAVITGLLVRDGLVTKIEAKVRGDNTTIGIGPDLVSLTRSLPVTEVESIFLISAKEQEQTITLQLQCNYLGLAFPLSIKVRLAGGTGAQEVIRFGSVRASKDLLEHLNSEKLHYSQAIYRSLDASSLALLLSPYNYQGKPVVQMIDPTPVTISGNYLVFKMHEEEYKRDGEEALTDWGKWLKDHGISKSRVKTELVPLPSGGVFAEAVLGRYNSAEKLDMTRFWNWQDSPIPITAPEIAPVELTSRGTTEDLRPGQLGAPVVSIVNPTALPDPTGMAAVLQAIQNGNMFRDMSGLAATMGLAQAGINAASQGATAAGAQAGTNAATAAQLFSDLAKTAASVATMGVGGALGGVAGGLLGSGGGGANISNAGALMNQGRAMAQRGAGDSASGGGSSGSTGNSSGSADSGAVVPGAADSSADFEAQAFRQAVWGQEGQSLGDTRKTLLGFALSDTSAADAGAAASATQPAFPTRYTEPFAPNDKLQQALDSAKSGLPVAMKTRLAKVPFSIVRLGSSGAHAVAGFKDREVHFSGSLAKVAAMYAAFELGKAAKNMASQVKPATPKELFDALHQHFDAQIRKAVPDITNAAGITDEHLLPHYEAAFEAVKAPSGEYTVDFKQSLKDDMESMTTLVHGIPASNASARNCIHAIGYGYINGALANGGFFEPRPDDPAKKHGIWLAGDYMSQWPPVLIMSENDQQVRQALTTHHLAKLFTLLFDRKLVGDVASNSMLGILSRAGSWFTTTTPKLSSDTATFKVTHAKVGLGDLKSNTPVVSEGSILHHKAHDTDFVVVWQNLAGPAGNDNLKAVAKLIDDTIDKFFAS